MPLETAQFWGKAQPQNPKGPQWHPLTYHCLDVAAVGEVLLAQHRGFGESLPALLGMSEDNTIQVVRYLLCLHDVGKFAKRFQAKVPSRFPEYFEGNPFDLSHNFDHASGGMRLFEADGGIFALPGGSRGLAAWRPLISAVMGHHGTPPTLKIGIRETNRSLWPDFGKPGLEAASIYIQEVIEFSPLPKEMEAPDRNQAIQASYGLAGFAVLADWIGSNQHWFPYHAPSLQLESYWSIAHENAQRAVSEAGLIPAVPRSFMGYSELIGTRIVPSPMQDWASSVELPKGPALFLIEDETGSGKTEAALMLTHRLMKKNKADGLYMALPTMATTNAMFDRLARAIRLIFTEDSSPSLALIHSARDIHPGFRSATMKGGRKESPYSDTDMEADMTASATCAEWIADDRRRGFLADAGAGTIDQALLAILPSRHQSLRLLGLMRRILILDEIHAYDAYMQREIETLLEFQAGLGGSVILLSATLPVSIRKRLSGAFEKGLGGPINNCEVSTAYPLVTVSDSQGRTSKAVAGQSGRARKLPVQFLRTTADALYELRKAAEDGQAVLYIRNTVDDAIEAYSEIAAMGLEVQIFHARFALWDRLKIEESVVKAFGKGSQTSERAGRVLIATQVVEQSLDLDFDTLITDLAPIDLLIQRAGRLWRHDRPERRGQPKLFVVSPEPTPDADKEWFARSFPKAAYVYQDHARLWLTARVLEQEGAIDSPCRLRSLIESVYNESADAEGLPTDLEGRYFEAEGKSGAERSVANTNVLSFSSGYVRDGGAWDMDVRTHTRLADDPGITLRLACVRESHLEPYAKPASSVGSWKAWRLSEINVSSRRVGGEVISEMHKVACQRAKAEWSRFDLDKVLVVLERISVGGDLVGTVQTGRESATTVQICYDAKVGLRWI